MKNVIIRIIDFFKQINNWLIKQAKIESKVRYDAWVIEQRPKNALEKVYELEKRIEVLEENLTSLK